MTYTLVHGFALSKEMPRGSILWYRYSTVTTSIKGLERRRYADLDKGYDCAVGMKSLGWWAPNTIPYNTIAYLTNGLVDASRKRVAS